MPEDLIRKGDLMARVVQEVKEALERGGVSTGFTLTTPDYGEFDAYVEGDRRVQVRVELDR